MGHIQAKFKLPTWKATVDVANSTHARGNATQGLGWGGVAMSPRSSRVGLAVQLDGASWCLPDDSQWSVVVGG